jgi:acyl-CoA hydrolase
VRTATDADVAARIETLAGHDPRVVAGGNLATPWHLVDLADGMLPAYRLLILNAQAGAPVRQGVTLETPFVGPGMRDKPTLAYIPMRLSLVPEFLAGPGAPDVVLVQTSPPRGGKLSLGVEVNVLPAAIEAARRRGGLVVAQVNRHMPYTLGDGEMDEECFDLVLEHDAPIPSPPSAEPDDTSLTIAERVARLVQQGTTLQIGIGSVPDATLGHVRDKRGLRVWSEMASDGVLALERSGALDPERPVTASFLMGSQELYEWADRNGRLRLLRTETANDPMQIAANDSMLSLNTALQVDLFAQANASWVRGRVYSGFGGQTDFVVGALHSRGGHAVIALPSWHPKADRTSVVPLLDSPVTSFQHSAIVTEQGCAFLFGRSQREQAEAIVSQAAHPAARDDLRAAMGGVGLPG